MFAIPIKYIKRISEHAMCEFRPKLYALNSISLILYIYTQSLISYNFLCVSFILLQGRAQLLEKRLIFCIYLWHLFLLYWPKQIINIQFRQQLMVLHSVVRLCQRKNRSYHEKHVCDSVVCFDYRLY